LTRRSRVLANISSGSSDFRSRSGAGAAELLEHLLAQPSISWLIKCPGNVEVA
jgi:hypothetical protein